jgi:hypothetical protein
MEEVTPGSQGCLFLGLKLKASSPDRNCLLHLLATLPFFHQHQGFCIHFWIQNCKAILSQDLDMIVSRYRYSLLYRLNHHHCLYSSANTPAPMPTLARKPSANANSSPLSNTNSRANTISSTNTHSSRYSSANTNSITSAIPTWSSTNSNSC